MLKGFKTCFLFWLLRELYLLRNLNPHEWLRASLQQCLQLTFLGRRIFYSSYLVVKQHFPEHSRVRLWSFTIGTVLSGFTYSWLPTLP